jgi:hypothetical protein
MFVSPRTLTLLPPSTKILTSFGHLKEMGFRIPTNIQALLLLAQIPSPKLDSVAHNISAKNIKALDSPEVTRVLHTSLNFYWENKVGKKTPSSNQKAQKLSMVKKAQGTQQFSDQQDDHREGFSRGNDRG